VTVRLVVHVPPEHDPDPVRTAVFPRGPVAVCCCEHDPPAHERVPVELNVLPLAVVPPPDRVKALASAMPATSTVAVRAAAASDFIMANSSWGQATPGLALRQRMRAALCGRVAENRRECNDL
jgi:hypothetical protein